MIGWDGEVTMQCEDEAHILAGAERDRCLRAYLDQYPDGRQREEDPDIAHISIRPTWLRYSDYRPDTFEINENHLDA